MPTLIPVPDGLSERSAALWRHLVTAQARTPQRRALLLEALRCLDRADECRETIRHDGLTVTTTGSGVVHVHPLAKLEKESRADFIRAWEILGYQMGYLDTLLPPEAGGPAAETED